MPQLTLGCPHCLTTRIGFAAKHAVALRSNPNLTLLFLTCEGCGGGVIAEIHNSLNHVRVWMVDGGASSPGNIFQSYPSLREPKAPADVPEYVLKAFLSGLRNLQLRDANAAAIMFRRSIELAAKKLNPEGKGDLKTRIAELSDDYVTPAMKEWGDTHSIRC